MRMRKDNNDDDDEDVVGAMMNGMRMRRDELDEAR